MSDAPENRDTHEPARPSRQELVVPPRQSNWPVVIGAVASGLAGFGLVFGLGIGRSRSVGVGLPPQAEIAMLEDTRDTSQQPGVEPTSHLPPDQADDLLPPPLTDVPSTPGRWSVPDGDGPVTDITAGSPLEPADRYAARMVSHDELPVPPVEQRRSRFSSADLPPLDPVAADFVPADSVEDEGLGGGEALGIEAGALDGAERTLSAAPEADSPAWREEAQPFHSEAVPRMPPSDTQSDPDLPAAGAELEPSLVVSEATETPPPSPPVGFEPEQAAVVAPAVAVPSPDDEKSEPASNQPWGDSSAVNPQSSVNPFGPPPASAKSQASAQVPTPPVGAPAGDGVEQFVAPAAATAVETVAMAAVPAAMPFAAAPPLSPAPASPFDEDHATPGDHEPASINGATGQGMPGPLQLEGVQTPQLAVEKRGPREIQVGKPARYETLVRNVGSATAHDVILRDAVPRGTALIATTPPATPASDDSAAAGDLVWALGVLPPGGEVRVLMELMPEEEGELGSVASVSFRADATLRSRSTKPALAIDCPQPEPVRIGRDMQVTVTVSNPGSGVATGVVLEAFLPETVSHRAGSELEFDVGQLRPGESKTIDLVLGTRGPGLQPSRLIARADGGIEENLQVPVEVTAPTLELAIDMPAKRFLQRPATCAIKMVNAGTASARSVELAAQLPAGLKFVRANNAGWHDERTHRVLWNLEELPSGETGTVEVVVMPVQPGQQRITAAARSTDGPSAQVAHLCSVEGLAAISFQVMDSEDPIEVDGLTEYVIRVANEGTKAATGVRLAATLLGDLEPVEATGPGRHRVENLAVEFEPLAKLGPGEEAVYRVRARGRRAGDHRVQVQLVSEEHPTPITKEEVTSVYDDR
jgi:uncharacterized repeat protein (TIGR01451 family)